MQSFFNSSLSLFLYKLHKMGNWQNVRKSSKSRLGSSWTANNEFSFKTDRYPGEFHDFLKKIQLWRDRKNIFRWKNIFCFFSIKELDRIFHFRYFRASTDLSEKKRRTFLFRDPPPLSEGVSNNRLHIWKCRFFVTRILVVNKGE